jgi:hypothetical protein
MKTIDGVLEHLWETSGAPKPFDITVTINFYEWVNTSDHSEGFNLLGSLDITNRLTFGELQAIIEETEDFLSGQSGLIKGSGLTQEFNEQTTGYAAGTILKQILTMDSDDDSYWYKYPQTAAGDDVHLWELQVDIGDGDTYTPVAQRRWLSPAYSWIYGWIFDTDNEDTPLWDGTGRTADPQTFVISGYTLLHWLEKIHSAWLGDFKNPMGIWGDRSEGEDISDDTDNFTLMGKAGNYPTPPMIKRMLNQAGVIDDNIEKLEVPVDTGSTPDYSTVEFEDTINLGSGGAEQYQLPEPFFWKSVLDASNNPVYYIVWCSYKSATTYFKVTAWNRGTGEIITESVQPNMIMSGESCPQTAYPRRWWYPGTGNVFYILMEDTGTSAWYLWIVTLGGTIGEVADNSSMSETVLEAPSGSYERHWGQCDLDQTNLRVYALQSYNGPAAQDDSYLLIGYWDLLAAGAWQTVYDSGQDQYSFIIQKGSGDGTPLEGRILTGFQCLTTSTNHGIAAFVSKCGYPEGYPTLMVMYFDDSQAAPQYELYDEDYGTPTTILQNEWETLPFLDGRGSIGGFYDSSPSPAKYMFQLTGYYYGAHSTKIGYWLSWDAVTAYTNFDCDTQGGYIYRTFGSSGSANRGCSLGFTYENRDLDGVDIDYHIRHYEAYCYRDGSTETTVRDTTDGGWDAGDANEWPILSAPSVSDYSGIEDDTRYRPFLMWKSFVDSEGEQRYRTFLVIFSEHWIQNFSHDFYSNGGSIKEELQDIALACGVKMRLGLWSTVIKEYYYGTEDDVVKTITAGIYESNKVTSRILPKYDKVSIDWGGDDPAEYPSASKSKNELPLTTNYLINEKRALKRAEELYDLFNKNRIEYTVKSWLLHMLEPLDIVLFHPPISPGGRGEYDGDDATLCEVRRLEHNGVDSRIVLVSLDEVQDKF